MANEESHPITTPKGAGAISILLGVVGVFTPFLFNLQAALIFGVIAVIIIVWMYSSEIRATWAGHSWDKGLNVPLGSVVAIIMMALISVRNVANSPKPVPPVSAEEVAQKIENWLEGHQSRKAQSPPQVVTAAAPPETKSPRIPTPPKLSQKKVVRTPVIDKGWEQTLRQIREMDAKYAALSKCTDRKMPIYTGLWRLSAQAANYQNGWAYSRDGEQLRNQYVAWVGAVRQFFSEHREVLPNTDAFDQIKELDMGPTLFLIPNSGVNAWHNFDERRKVLEKIAVEFNQNSCKAEREAVNADYKSATTKAIDELKGTP